MSTSFHLAAATVSAFPVAFFVDTVHNDLLKVMASSAFTRAWNRPRLHYTVRFGRRTICLLCVSITHKMRKACVLAHVRCFRRRPECIASGLLLDLLFADSAHILGDICADKHMLKILMPVLLDPVKYLIVFMLHPPLSHFQIVIPCIEIDAIIVIKDLATTIIQLLAV